MADPNEVIVAQPLVAGLLPYVVSGLGALITAVAAWAVAELHKKTGIQISQHDQAIFEKAASAQAGKIVSEAAAGWDKTQFSVGSPEVAAAVNTVMTRVPEVADRLGMTPSKFGDLVLGELGKLQATATGSTTAISK